MEKRVIEVIESELDYAEEKWSREAEKFGVQHHDSVKPLEFWLLHMQRNLSKAIEASAGFDKSKAKEFIRKVTGLGVSAIDNLFIPPRE